MTTKASYGFVRFHRSIALGTPGLPQVGLAPTGQAPFAPARVGETTAPTETAAGPNEAGGCHLMYH
jgi:hypothetical protein